MKECCGVVRYLRRTRVILSRHKLVNERQAVTFAQYGDVLKGIHVAKLVVIRFRVSGPTCRIRDWDLVECSRSVPCQLHGHAVAATPNTPTEIAAARAEIAVPLSKAFVDSIFTVEQQSAILIFGQSSVLFYRYLEQSLASVLLPKLRSLSLLIRNP